MRDKSHHVKFTGKTSKHVYKLFLQSLNQGYKLYLETADMQTYSKNRFYSAISLIFPAFLYNLLQTSEIYDII